MPKRQQFQSLFFTIYVIVLSQIRTKLSYAHYTPGGSMSTVFRLVCLSASFLRPSREASFVPNTFYSIVFLVCFPINMSHNDSACQPYFFRGGWKNFIFYLFTTFILFRASSSFQNIKAASAADGGVDIGSVGRSWARGPLRWNVAAVQSL
jgi:hypothetical protein